MEKSWKCPGCPLTAQLLNHFQPIFYCIGRGDLHLCEKGLYAYPATAEQPIYTHKTLPGAKTTCQHLKTRDRVALGAGVDGILPGFEEAAGHRRARPRLARRGAARGTLLAPFSIYRSLSEMALLSEQMSKN